MTIPAFLTGSAGRAIDDVMRVRGYASASSFALTNVVGGSSTPRAAMHALDLLGDAGSSTTLRALVNDARPGLRTALGNGQTHASATMQAELATIRAARASLSRPGVTATQLAHSARAGAEAAEGLVATIDRTMPLLHSTARRTAATRITIGALGVGGAIAGIHHLAAGDDSRELAPGPFVEPGATHGFHHFTETGPIARDGSSLGEAWAARE